jgi:hypothetical protein
MSETKIMRDIRNAISATGRATLWRNNVGFDAATQVKYGLGKGSADLVGFIYETGRFFAIEVKTPRGRLSSEQKCWIEFVLAHGGYACVARSVDDALKELEKACAK